MLLSVDGDRNGHINVFKDNLKNFPKKFKGVRLIFLMRQFFVIPLNFVAWDIEKL